MNELNNWILRGLSGAAFFLVLNFFISGTRFEETVIMLLIVTAYRVYFPYVVMLAPMEEDHKDDY